MATRPVTYDDITGEENATTRYFAVGDEAFEIDLVDANWEAFQNAIDKYVEKARPAQAKKATKNGSGVNHAAVREWAKANNKPYNERGRHRPRWSTNTRLPQARA